jgi:hypothetical protein
MPNRLRSVNIDPIAILKKVLQRPVHQEEIAELNREQLRKGKRSDGSNILPAYSPKYAKRKRRTPTPVILYDEGNYYEGFIQKFTNDGFSMFSTDQKNDILAEKYGVKIQGLTKESRIKLIHSYGVGNEFVREVRSITLKQLRNV